MTTFPFCMAKRIVVLTGLEVMAAAQVKTSVPDGEDLPVGRFDWGTSGPRGGREMAGVEVIAVNVSCGPKYVRCRCAWAIIWVGL